MVTNRLAMVIGFIILVGYIVFALLTKKSSKRIAITGVLIIYLTGVACVTLFPIFYDTAVEYSDTIRWYNLVPIKSIIEVFRYGVNATNITQVFGNVVLTTPFGVLILMLFKLPKWWHKALVALAFPLAIELTQMFIGLSIGNMYRTVDINDVILNFIGVCIGYAIYTLLYKIIGSSLDCSL